MLAAWAGPDPASKTTARIDIEHRNKRMVEQRYNLFASARLSEVWINVELDDRLGYAIVGMVAQVIMQFAIDAKS